MTKFNPNGTQFVYSTYIGGKDGEWATSIALDQDRNVYISGLGNWCCFPTPNGLQGNRGWYDAIVAKLDRTGSRLLFGSYLGGVDWDEARAIAVHSTGNIYVAGGTYKSGFPVTAGALQTQRGTSTAFVARIGGRPIPQATLMTASSAADSRAPGAPGAVVRFSGTNLAPGSENASGVPLPLSLAGTTLRINGQLAPLVSVSRSQVVAQVPFELAPGTATAEIQPGGGLVAPPSLDFYVAEVAPAVFASTGNRCAAQNPDGALNSPANAVLVGSVITIYLTGQGRVAPAVPTGEPAPSGPFAVPVLPFSATIEGQDAVIQFLGLAPGQVGVAQANLIVPAVDGGDRTVVLRVGSARSAGCYIRVRAE